MMDKQITLNKVEQLIKAIEAGLNVTALELAMQIRQQIRKA